jgi:hypothetical protein
VQSKRPTDPENTHRCYGEAEDYGTNRPGIGNARRLHPTSQLSAFSERIWHDWNRLGDSVYLAELIAR